MTCHHCVVIVDDLPGVQRLLAAAQAAGPGSASDPGPGPGPAGRSPDSEPLVLEIRVRQGPFAILRDWFPSGGRAQEGRRS